MLRPDEQVLEPKELASLAWIPQLALPASLLPLFSQLAS